MIVYSLTVKFFWRYFVYLYSCLHESVHKSRAIEIMTTDESPGGELGKKRKNYVQTSPRREFFHFSLHVIGYSSESIIFLLT